MKDKHHVVVIDPTAFNGGSKVATESILRLIDSQKFHITVLSADKFSWHSKNINKINLYEPKWLSQKEQGIYYFMRHAFIALNLLIARIRFGRFDIALGASGPGVDLALYLLRPWMKMNIIQLIHGPVAKSRTIARCLKVAYQVHYLQSSAASLQATLSLLNPQKSTLPAHFYLLKNGLSEETWPTACQTHTPVIFWAASLLKWKGLDTLLEALHKIPEKQRPKTHICYIEPQGVKLLTTKAPINMTHVEWHENPHNINQFRANSNIFVSTSKNEPFGLSILEAMAAGHCVLIPADNAYWDQTLTHNIDCIKYRPEDSEDLKRKLLMLSQNRVLVSKLGKRAAKLALNYSAKKQYKNIVNSIQESIVNKSEKSNA